MSFCIFVDCKTFGSIQVRFEESGMGMGTQSRRCGNASWVRYSAPAALIVVFLILSSSQNANALPAFARKYGLRCSACHESWPMLNYFGQKFKDNGYQLMNDHDAPIWQNPGYWPVTFRMIPLWHRVSQGKVAVDGTDDNPPVEQRI